VVYCARPGAQNAHVAEQCRLVRILILQFVSDVRGRPVPRFEPKLATLLTLLKQRGHDLSLLGLARFDMAAVKAALARALPQLVYADVSSLCTNTARRTLQYVEEHEFLPIVAGGEYATVDPSAALSLPGAHAVAIGEPDASLITYFERMKDPAINQIVQGVWLRDERGLARPELPSLVEDLDSLPFGERDLFGYGEYVRKTGEIEVAVGRGCPQRCAYCVNGTVAEMYTARGQWVRRRSPEDVLDEIDALRQRYAGVRIVRFLDHSFALDAGWLSELLAAYPARCGLPFRCHLRANATTEPIVQRLAQAHCKLVDIELISGSDFIRNEIFEMELNRAQIESTFELLRAAGIKTRAILYLGSPYESEASLDDTRELLRRLKPDTVSARPYYPFPGTRATETARENGWLHSRGEEQYHEGRTGIDMPACRPDFVAAFLKRIRRQFPTTLEEPWWRRWSQAPRNSLLSQFFQKRR
jgi:anaerobic magnesium-protoporphyrin IX monomethyl ester cyclase